MVQVLVFYGELIFTEWFEKTINQFKMDKKTFIARKKKLEKNGTVKHSKGRYFLVPRNRRKIFQNLNKKIVQYQTEAKAIYALPPENISFLRKSVRLLEKIFQELYVQLQYERLCFLNDYSKGEQVQINQSLNRCEKIISDLAELIKKTHPTIGKKILPPGDVIFIEKVQRSK